MKTKLFCMLFLCCCIVACDKQTGKATVIGSSGRTSCEWVQLWEDGPKWATFNVGATITDYAQLTEGTDPTSFFDNTELASYYNTANVGGLYAWMNPNLNGRMTTWIGVDTRIYDVATALWGSNWETPTMEQWNSLNDNTYTTWTWCDGSTTQYVKGCTLKGYKVSGVGEYAQYSIFLPAAGYFGYYGKVGGSGLYGYYWSSTGGVFDYAYYLDFYSDDPYSLDFYSEDHEIRISYREVGQSVRAVLAE